MSNQVPVRNYRNWNFKGKQYLELCYQKNTPPHSCLFLFAGPKVHFLRILLHRRKIFSKRFVLSCHRSKRPNVAVVNHDGDRMEIMDRSNKTSLLFTTIAVFPSHLQAKPCWNGSNGFLFTTKPCCFCFWIFFAVKISSFDSNNVQFTLGGVVYQGEKRSLYAFKDGYVFSSSEVLGQNVLPVKPPIPSLLVLHVQRKGPNIFTTPTDWDEGIYFLQYVILYNPS